VDHVLESKRRLGGTENGAMAILNILYRVNPSVDFDEELREILEDYGMKGWELVQVLQPQNDARYHLVFKTQRPLYPKLEPAKQ
jgi:hypothetical protein